MTPKEFLAARKSAGLTQHKAAERLGINRSTLARWEAGDSRIPLAAGQVMQQIGALGRAANRSKAKE